MAIDFGPYFRSLIVEHRDGKPVYNVTATVSGKSMITFAAIMKEIQEGRAFGVYVDGEGRWRSLTIAEPTAGSSGD